MKKPRKFGIKVSNLAIRNAKKGIKTFDKINKHYNFMLTDECDDCAHVTTPIEFVVWRVVTKFTRQLLKKAWAKRKRPDTKLITKVSRS